jgi:hypothetical protein
MGEIIPILSANTLANDAQIGPLPAVFDRLGKQAYKAAIKIESGNHEVSFAVAQARVDERLTAMGAQIAKGTLFRADNGDIIPNTQNIQERIHIASGLSGNNIIAGSGSLIIDAKSRADNNYFDTGERSDITKVYASKIKNSQIEPNAVIEGSKMSSTTVMRGSEAVDVRAKNAKIGKRARLKNVKLLLGSSGAQDIVVNNAKISMGRAVKDFTVGSKKENGKLQTFKALLGGPLPDVRYRRPRK